MILILLTSLNTEVGFIPPHRCNKTKTGHSEGDVNQAPSVNAHTPEETSGSAERKRKHRCGWSAGEVSNNCENVVLLF